MIRKLSAISAGLILAVMLPACSSSSSPVTTTPPTTTPPCTQTVLFQRSGELPTLGLAAVPFSTSTTGRIDVTVDWTFASSTIGVYLVSANSCNIDQFNARSCNFLIRSESGAKPRRLSASNVAVGAYELFIANFSDEDDSGTAQVVLSSSTCPAASTLGSASGDGASDRKLGNARAW